MKEAGILLQKKPPLTRLHTGPAFAVEAGLLVTYLLDTEDLIPLLGLIIFSLIHGAAFLSTLWSVRANIYLNYSKVPLSLVIISC